MICCFGDKTNGYMVTKLVIFLILICSYFEKILLYNFVIVLVLLKIALKYNVVKPKNVVSEPSSVTHS